MSFELFIINIVIVKRKLGHLIGRKLVHPDWAEDDSINVNH